MKTKKGNKNKNADSFEIELYSSLKSYGYIFPDNIKDVERFEELYGNTDINMPASLELPPNKEIQNIAIVDFSLFQNIAAYGNNDALPFKDLPKDLNKKSGLDNRSRDKDGQIRRKRSDTKVETLKKTYPEFDGINGNKHLGTLEKELGTDSLDSTRKKLKK